MTGVRVIGGRRLASTLDTAADRVANPADVDGQVAQLAAAAVAGNAPRRTGRLAGSVRPLRTAPGRPAADVGAAYGPFVNYGTRFMAGRRFVEAAAAQLEQPAAAVYDRHLDRTAQSVRGA